MFSNEREKDSKSRLMRALERLALSTEDDVIKTMLFTIAGAIRKNKEAQLAIFCAKFILQQKKEKQTSPEYKKTTQRLAANFFRQDLEN
jgi:hypothetical protein